ncbi:MAG: sulfur transferase domain-containing protein [Verrucomicrobia bacterium]|nr:sulfur transferase domain-containing protein [Verrucomicrobiota bacterium]
MIRRRPFSNPLLVTALALGATLGSLHAAPDTASVPTQRSADPIQIPGLENTFQVTEELYSGSQPDSDAAFAAIAKLGVKTIVSVDGSKPDVDGAHRYGLRYVHLPFGYDGIPTHRVAALAKVIQAAPGPFYVHCHHGTHRGPAAVAVMCLADQGWTPAQATAWLREAGTSDAYPGLYRVAREFVPLTQAELAAVPPFPEVAPTPSLVDAMVAMDRHFDWLKQSQAAGWKTPTDHPDISSGHEATMILEWVREIARAADPGKQSEDFKAKLAESEKAAEQLRDLLNRPADGPELDAAFSRVSQSCSDCHQRHRNE